ncbi:hypothetical protein [Thalassospira sp.]|uniref:hypothetical protein n=1 Tax=Thalassospira sp. TaxID=1912094 RepID=UPI0027328C09|nr:hypothetical protein [Thalassospira sp.]MDP2696798.1 hypothetical protein [Thalassospira sp.]
MIEFAARCNAVRPVWCNAMAVHEKKLFYFTQKQWRFVDAFAKIPSFSQWSRKKPLKQKRLGDKLWNVASF